jgi:hypothetical protein
MAQVSVTAEGIVRTMPMILESWRALLEDLAATVGAKNVVS